MVLLFEYLLYGCLLLQQKMLSLPSYKNTMIENLLTPYISGRFVSDTRYREGHLRVINALPQRRVLGLHTPEMKRIAQELWRKDGEGYIKAFEATEHAQLTYEETVIWGFLINKGKYTLEERFAMLARYVPVLDNWAVCDSYCANAKWLAKADKERVWFFLQQWFESHREFEVRFAVVVSMCNFLTEEWIGKVFERLNTIEFDKISSEYMTVKGKPKVAQSGTVQGTAPYYVRMAVAWLLATALAKLPDATRSYARAAQLPSDVIKMYVRKARESFRTRTVPAL